MIEKLNLRVLSFPDKESNIRAAEELRGMMNTAGWHFLENVLQSNIERYEKILLGEGDPETTLTDEERERLKFRRLDLKKLLNLPKAQISVLEGKPLDPSLDPYATADDIRQERESGAK